MNAPWSDQENDLIVDRYFQMLADDLAARSYNKAAQNRLIRENVNRTSGAIEFKLQNVSAVLKSLGEAWIWGYKPAFNFQASLIDAVVRWREKNPGWVESQVLRYTENVFFEEKGLYVGPPPTHSNLPEPKELENTQNIAAKFDVAGRDERNRRLGEIGERIVLKHERTMLDLEGRADLAVAVRWTAHEDGDGAGYDIASFNADGSRRYIEVKSTYGWERTPFHLSRNELETSERLAGEWRLVRVWNLAREPKAFELAPPLEAHVSLMPTSFQASFG